MPRNSQIGNFERNVFINCPFDDEYLSLLRPLLFTIVRLGFVPRIATERSDSGENRIDKITELIRSSRLSIHDISRLQAKNSGDYSRFNLPFELGLDRGAALFGTTQMRTKCCLILETKPYDYKRALSDLSGVDIKDHLNKPPQIVRAVRNWFVESVGVEIPPSATSLWYGFTEFASWFYDERSVQGFSDDDLNFMPVCEYIGSIRQWIKTRP